MTKEQVVETARSIRVRDWNLLIEMSPFPQPTSMVRGAVHHYLRRIAVSAQPLSEQAPTLLVTEIASAHAYPRMYALLGELDKFGKEKTERFETSWTKITDNPGQDPVFHRFYDGDKAFQAFCLRLDPAGQFFMEIDLGYVVLESSDTRSLSRIWDRLCEITLHP